ncbi:MAG: permease-like cell division protein FtsX [Actinobacteria bacterium]|uniref:Cell division protein FtsX n=1 Tax=freshwater metagenome TaxID=449393 RepID=A0A6J7AR92_9ZZZZ|nr:permease-like cell division protein FtsX [Actinomycetota bacterium]MSX64708.1 FtsX-like permease family protein [Actinomycetota bacterium]
MRANFVASEVSSGIRRNLTMTMAVIITVAVSLGLFGASMLVRAQVSTMKDFWYDKVEVSIFLCGKGSDTPSCAGGPVTKAQRDQIKADLESLKPLVDSVYYESQAEAFARFQEQFKNSPIVDNVKPTALPESFRVKLSDPTKYDVVASAFAGRPGIEQVNDQRKILDKFFRLLGGLQLIALLIALSMLVVTVLLIVNTMRVAAFSRRRETSIMRLVGASNFYIQLPFLLEAAVAAGIGAILAVVGLVFVKIIVIDQVLATSFQFTAFVGWDAVLAIAPLMILVGVGLAAIAAFFTLRKYLRV